MKRLFLFTTFLFLTSFSNTILAADNYIWKPWIQIRGDDFLNDFYGGSFVERADGKFLVAYRIDNKAMLSVVDSETELLTEANASAKNEWLFHTFYSSEKESDIRLQKLLNGRILLYLSEYGVKEDPSKPYKLEVHESVNGLGTDFAPKCTIYEQALPQYTIGARAIGQAIEFGGAIMMPFAAPVVYSNGPYEGMADSRLYCAISKNGGESFKFSQIANASFYRDPSKGFGIAGNRIIVLVHHNYASGNTTMCYHQLSTLLYTEEGQGPIENTEESDSPTWEFDESYIQVEPIDMTISHIFWQPDGYTYFLRDDYFEGLGAGQYYVYRRKSNISIDIEGQAPYQLGAIGSGATWEGPLNPVAYGDDGEEFFSVTSSGNLVIYGTSFFGGGSVSYLRVGKPNLEFPWEIFYPAFIKKK